MALYDSDINNKLYRLIDWLDKRPCRKVADALKQAAEQVLFNYSDGSAQIVRDAIAQAENIACDNPADYSCAYDTITIFRVAMFTDKRNARSAYHITHGKSIFHYIRTNRTNDHG